MKTLNLPEVGDLVILRRGQSTIKSARVVSVTLAPEPEDSIFRYTIQGDDPNAHRWARLSDIIGWQPTLSVREASLLARDVIGWTS